MIICHIQYCHLRCEMLRSSQGVLWLNGKAAPEDEGDEGHARSHQQDEVLDALPERGDIGKHLSIIFIQVLLQTMHYAAIHEN